MRTKWLTEYKKWNLIRKKHCQRYSYFSGFCLHLDFVQKILVSYQLLDPLKKHFVSFFKKNYLPFKIVFSITRSKLLSYYWQAFNWGSAYSFKGLVHEHRDGKQTATALEQQLGALHPDSQAACKETKIKTDIDTDRETERGRWGKVWTFKTSKLTLSDTFPPARAPLIFPKQSNTWWLRSQEHKPIRAILILHTHTHTNSPWCLLPFHF